MKTYKNFPAVVLQLFYVCLFFFIYTGSIYAATISGKAYSDEGLTPLADGLTVNLVVNGSSVNTTTTGSGTGAYSFSAVTLSAGDKVLVFLDNATEKGNTVTVASGIDITDLNIFQDHIIVRNDNGGSTTNTDLLNARLSDTDMLYSVSGTTFTANNSGTEVYIPSGHSFAPGGDATFRALENLGTFSGGSGALLFHSGGLTLTSGTFTFSTGSNQINGHYTYTAGTVNSAGTTVRFGDNYGGNITGSHSLTNVKFDPGQSGGRGWNISAGTVLTVNGDLVLDNSSTGICTIGGTGVIEVYGNVIVDDRYYAGSATIKMVGSGTRTFSGSGGTVPSIEFAGTGTVNLSGTIKASKDWTYTSGTLNAGTSTVQFANYDTATITGSHTLNDVIINRNATGTRTLNVEAATTLTVNGSLTLDNAQTGVTNLDGGGTIEALGDVTIDDQSYYGSATIKLAGSGTQTFTGSGGRLPNVEIASTGTVNLSGTIAPYGNWTYTSGTLNPGTSTVRFVNYVYGGNLYITGSHALNNVLFDSGGSGLRTWVIEAGTVLTTTGTLTFDNSSTGATQINGNGSGVTLGRLSAQGDVTVGTGSGFFGNSVLEFSGSNTQSFDLTGGESSFDIDVTVNKSGGQVNLASALTMNQSNQDLTVDAGTFDLNGNDLTVTGAGGAINVNSGGNFQLQGSENMTISAGYLNAGSIVTYDGTVGPYTMQDWNYRNLVINGPGATFNLAANEIIQENLTITAGTLNLNGFNLTVNGAAFAVENGGNLQLLGSEIITTPTLNSGSNVIYADTSNQSIKGWSYQSLTLSGTGNVYSLAGSASIAQNLNVSSGIFDLAGYGLTVTGTVNNNGVIRLQGGEALNLTMDSDSGTVEYTGTGFYTGLTAGNSYNNLSFTGSGAWTQIAPLDVNGDFNIANGQLNSAGNDINVFGNWTNNGTYVAGTNKVILDGNDQTISGDTTFYDLEKIVTTAQTLIFASGSTTTVSNQLTLQGAANNFLSLRSSVAGSQFYIDPQATWTTSYLDVKDSRNLNGTKIHPSSSKNRGNTTEWFRLRGSLMLVE